ncbi:aspartate kinase [bacterium]|nr:aspartate kinase [bacterium]
MALIVQKFGGSSVADAKKIKAVAKIIIKTKEKGHQLVVVVSATGNTTNKLLKLAAEIVDVPCEREMDMLLSAGEQISIALLSMAIKAQKNDAISLTGAQAGICTDGVYNKARITGIKTKKLKKELKKGKIVVVAGFQGISPGEDITTLGRGGSDLTAVALAVVLKAQVCEIYTDVSGVYTADPRIVRDARKTDYLSFDEMLEMAGLGAQVMQARSVEMAKKFNVDLHIRSTFSQEKGTVITKEVSCMEDVVVSGVTYDADQVKMSIIELPDKPGIAAHLFNELAKKEINVDMIIQSSARDGVNNISFTISRTVLKKTLDIMNEIKKKLRAKEVFYDNKVAKVSLVGVGMKSHAGVASKMFSILAAEKINIEMISTSEIRISCVIKEKNLLKAVRVLHKKFKLNQKLAKKNISTRKS